MRKIEEQKIKSPKLAYTGYLFQMFLKRPFGYIVAALYVIYLAVIFLIVPAALHFNPLFIWTVGGFNVPIFNLFFIAGATASAAVAIFRTGREDGFDLNMSSKPFSKGTTVLLKTGVFLAIMLFVNLLTIVITALILPIFGELSVTNATGIEVAKYNGLLLSMFVGNLVNMLFFGGISVFISMVGGQVITIIGTVGCVFLLCLMNFLYPQILSTPSDILENRYDTSMTSVRSNTLAELLDTSGDSHPAHNYAAIISPTDDDGQEIKHFDTKEYWNIAQREAGVKASNYVDFGKQLSSLYSISNMSENRVEETSKFQIGFRSGYNYEIIGSTHVEEESNIESLNYPLCLYDVIFSQGKSIPYVRLIGADMSASLNNWSVKSALYNIDYDSIAYLSDRQNDGTLFEYLSPYVSKPGLTLKELIMTPEQRARSKQLHDIAIAYYDPKSTDPHNTPTEITQNVIKFDTSGLFFKGSYEDLELEERFNIVTKNLLYWVILAHQEQMAAIDQYCKEHEEFKDEKFPYSSKVIVDWRRHVVSAQEGYLKKQLDYDMSMLANFACINGKNTDKTFYTKLNSVWFSYPETFSNLYQYKVSNFYDMSTIIAIWTCISICLFAGAVLVYKRTDFK